MVNCNYGHSQRSCCTVTIKLVDRFNIVVNISLGEVCGILIMLSYGMTMYLEQLMKDGLILPLRHSSHLYSLADVNFCGLW